MPKHAIGVSRQAFDALAVLGQQIHEARLAKGWTIADVASRVGVDHRTIRAAERGAPTVAIGTVFNAAVLLGVDLFGRDPQELAQARRRGEDILALLPSRVRLAKADGDDGIDF